MFIESVVNVQLQTLQIAYIIIFHMAFSSSIMCQALLRSILVLFILFVVVFCSAASFISWKVGTCIIIRITVGCELLLYNTLPVLPVHFYIIFYEGLFLTIVHAPYAPMEEMFFVQWPVAMEIMRLVDIWDGFPPSNPLFLINMYIQDNTNTYQ